jgi:hypothetical protein
MKKAEKELPKIKADPGAGPEVQSEYQESGNNGPGSGHHL